METMNHFGSIEKKIVVIRGQQVIIDSNVAALYGVETKRINEAVKNNPDKFPIGYILELSREEWLLLKSNSSTSIKGGKTKLPNAFTEKGLYMLATILKSPIATQTTLSIIEAFAKIRELSSTISSISNTDDESKQKSILQKSSEIIADLLDNHITRSEAETSVELNLAILKVKHTVRHKPK